MNFASTLSKEYIDYEKKIREKSTENEEFDFKKMQEQFNINNIFGKTSQNISKQEMDIFYQDFIRIFIFENMKQINHLDEILKIILEIKFGKDLDTYDKVGEVILWVKSYSNFIIDILKFCEELKFDLEIFKKEVSQKVEDRIENNNDDLDMINCSEPFYSIIEYLTCYCIEHSELFNQKIGALDYCCELLIQNIQEYFKNIISQVKLFSFLKIVLKYIKIFLKILLLIII